MNFNYEIINKEFENDKAWEIILNFNYFKNNGGIDLNPNLKIFNLPNNKFELISYFQMKSSFPNIIL